MKKKVIYFSIFLIIISLGFFAVRFYLSKKEMKKTQVQIGQNIFKVDVADNFASRSQGLSGRKGMKDDEGMLFIFQTPGRYGFWMKDMNFPLDMVWIRDKKIIEITENLPAPSGILDIASSTPKEDVDMVLEINAGLSRKLNISVGQQIGVK